MYRLMRMMMKSADGTDHAWIGFRYVLAVIFEYRFKLMHFG